MRYLLCSYLFFIIALSSWSSASLKTKRIRDKNEESRSQKLNRKSSNAADLKQSKIEDVCRAAMMSECGCKRNFCLSSVGDTITESLKLLVNYMTPWMVMSKKEHREKFFPILEGCALTVSEGRHLDKK